MPGGAEVAAQVSELDSLCPSMPLDVFRVYDVAEVSQVSCMAVLRLHGLLLGCLVGAGIK